MRLCRMFRRSVSLNCSKRSFYRRSPRLRLRSAEAWLPIRERITATWRKSIPKDKRPGWRLHLKSGWGLAEIRCGCTGQDVRRDAEITKPLTSASEDSRHELQVIWWKRSRSMGEG